MTGLLTCNPVSRLSCHTARRTASKPSVGQIGRLASLPTWCSDGPRGASPAPPPASFLPDREGGREERGGNKSIRPRRGAATASNLFCRIGPPMSDGDQSEQ